MMVYNKKMGQVFGSRNEESNANPIKTNNITSDDIFIRLKVSYLSKDLENYNSMARAENWGTPKIGKKTGHKKILLLLSKPPFLVIIFLQTWKLAME